MIHVDLVDAPAYTPPYDHALASALARAGAQVRLVTSEFAFSEVPAPDGYRLIRPFYRHAVGRAGSRLRTGSKLLQHGPDMLRYRHLSRAADVVHFQWLLLPRLDVRLLPPRPRVLTVHDPVSARRLECFDAIVVHTERARSALVSQGAAAPERIEVIRHGALSHLASVRGPRALPPELPDPPVPVVLCFGVIRPYKGIETLAEAWRGIAGAELWIVGRPMVELEALRAPLPPGVRTLTRFVSDAEQAALFERADLVVLPYSRSGRFGFSGVLATALAFGRASLVTDVGGFTELAELGATRLVEPGDPAAMHDALEALLADPEQRGRLAAAARAAAEGPYSWERAARATLDLYDRIRSK